MRIRSLYWKITLSLILFIVIIGLSNGVVLFQHLNQIHRLLFGEGWHEIASLLARSLEADLIANPRQPARQLLLGKTKPSREGMMLWCSPDGQVTDLSGDPVRLSGPLCRAIQQQTGIRVADGSQSPVASSWLRHFDWLAPLGAAAVRHDGQVVGAVIVTPSPRIAADLQKLHPEYGLLRLGWLLATISFAALILYYPLKRRIRQLAAGVAAMASGDFAFRISPQGRDELGQLSRQFNQMAGELERMRDALQDENNKRKRLMQNIAHDLGTPLTSIRGYIETLQMEDSRFSAEQIQYLQIIQGEADRLDRLIGDLTDLVQLDASAIRVKPALVELGGLFDQLMQRYHPGALNRQIKLESILASSSLSIITDPHRLGQILDNLLSNAMRVTPPGGRVCIESRGSASKVEIAVSDTGPGIAPEQQDRIFDRFYRTDSARTGEAGGSGLGLAIVKELTQLLGGSIQVESRLGAGARFTLVLPLELPMAE